MRTLIKIKLITSLLLFFNWTFVQAQTQVIRIDFENSEGFTRELAIGFLEDNSATDGIDYGYDAPCIDDLEDDLNWMIEENRYVIQGVGAFSDDKYYPLGMFLSNSGDVSISLNTLENFEDDIDVFIYDLELDTYAQLSEIDLTHYMQAGNYINRFFITFSNNVHYQISANYELSVNDNRLSSIAVKYFNEKNKLVIDGLSNNEVADLTLFNLQGQKISQSKIFGDTAINILNLTQGIYIIQLETETLRETFKVCISN